MTHKIRKTLHPQIFSPPQQQPIQQQQQQQQQPILQNYSIPLDGILPGGRLTHFQSKWEDITHHPWPLQIIKEGYRLQFTRTPIPWHLPRQTRTREDQEEVNFAVKKFLKAGIIEHCHDPRARDHLSPFFTLKEATKNRPILDCRRINQCFQVNHFKMEGVPALRDLIESNDYMGLKAISRVRKRRDRLPIQVAQFWLKCRSTNFLQDITLCNRTVKGTRHQTSVLFRRHLYPSSGQFPFTRHGKAGNLTPRIFGIHNQFRKECADSFTHTGLSRFPVQHQEDGDQSSRCEDQEPQITTETNLPPSIKILQVGSRSDGEDHGDDTGRERGVITHPVSAERLGQIANQESSQLGRSVRVVTTIPGRDSVVATIHNLEEWTTNKKIATEDSSDNHTYGQFGDRVGSFLPSDGDVRVLDGRRETMVDQCKRTAGHLFCAQAPWTKISKQNVEDIHGQPNINQIYNQGRRHCLTDSPGHCGENTGNMQSVSSDSDLSTHTRSEECGSRQTLEAEDSIVRTGSTIVDFQGTATILGTVDLGHICNETEQEGSQILHNDGPRREATATPMEINPAGPRVDKGTEVETGSTSNAVVAKSVLVSHDITDETPGSPSNISTPIGALGRLEVIRQSRINNGLSEDEATYLDECVRSSTAKAYDNGWQKWVQWFHNTSTPYDPLLLQSSSTFTARNLLSPPISAFKHSSHPEDERTSRFQP
ncbi:hypothetical protein G6F42_018730 [Rhizopus arrhizus]|nr:hypothetical protein G6F42_018730 [Rhizopus arrhizus]